MIHIDALKELNGGEGMILQRIKQLFCKHVDLKEYRCKTVSGYAYQCPKCGAYFLYFKDFDGTVKISKKLYDQHIELANTRSYRNA